MIRTHRRATIYAWSLGMLNGAIAVLAVDVTYTLLSSGGLYLVPWWLAAPFAAYTAWRAATFVECLIQGTEKAWRPAAEGFALMFGSAVLYLVPNIIIAHLNGAPPQGWGWAFWGTFVGYVLLYSVPVGLFGGFVGMVLGQLDVFLVTVFPPLRTTQMPSDATLAPSEPTDTIVP